MRVAAQVLTEIKSIPKGTPFKSLRFYSLGNSKNIEKILERLAIAGEIKRVLRGVYVRPKVNPYVGEIAPSTYEIVKAVTTASGETIQIHGAEAVKQLGLSTQAPVKPIFLTNGRSRTITLGKLEIELRHTTPKKLILAGTDAGIALTALWYLGKEQVTVETIANIKARISAEEFLKLVNHLKQMPAWMVLVLRNYIQTEPDINCRPVNEVPQNNTSEPKRNLRKSRP